MKRDDVILVRGGGDLATGTIHRLWSAGLKVLVLEAEHPAAIRRQVSVSEAVYEGGAVVEGMRAALVKTLDEAVVIWHRGDVPVMVDPKGELIPQVQPAALVDAILAKKNLGTTRDMAPLTIALGPGFTAGVDVDFVVETKRGHRLGRIIREGAAIPNTGVPGVIGGYGAERVIHAEKAGIFRNVCAIGDIVSAGETIAEIETPDGIRTPVTTRIAGILRGLGRPVVPMMVMLAVWCLLRITYITVTLHFIRDIGVVFWAYPLTWSISSVLFAWYILHCPIPKLGGGAPEVKA